MRAGITLEQPLAGSYGSSRESAQLRRFPRAPTSWPRPRRSDLHGIREGQRTPAVLRRDTRVRRSLAVADLAAAALALCAPIALSGRHPYVATVAAPPFV